MMEPKWKLKCKMIRELNIALIGCGNWGKNIARNLYQMGSLTCIYDSNIKLSEKLSYDYSLPTLELNKISTIYYKILRLTNY